jgi:hypothetical protein
MLRSDGAFLAYFPYMEVGLSNHQSVCPFVCNPLITSETLGKVSCNLVRRYVIQGDLNAIIFNPIASIILKLLKFKVVK